MGRAAVIVQPRCRPPLNPTAPSSTLPCSAPLQGFSRARLTFLHQRVWCPRDRRLTTVTPLPSALLATLSARGAAASDSPAVADTGPAAASAGILDFLGPELSEELAAAIAIGAIDPITKLPFHEDAISLAGAGEAPSRPLQKAASASPDDEEAVSAATVAVGDTKAAGSDQPAPRVTLGDGLRRHDAREQSTRRADPATTALQPQSRGSASLAAAVAAALTQQQQQASLASYFPRAPRDSSSAQTLMRRGRSCIGDETHPLRARTTAAIAAGVGSPLAYAVEGTSLSSGHGIMQQPRYKSSNYFDATALPNPPSNSSLLGRASTTLSSPGARTRDTANSFTYIQVKEDVAQGRAEGWNQTPDNSCRRAAERDTDAVVTHTLASTGIATSSLRADATNLHVPTPLPLAFSDAKCARDTQCDIPTTYSPSETTSMRDTVAVTAGGAQVLVIGGQTANFSIYDDGDGDAKCEGNQDYNTLCNSVGGDGATCVARPAHAALSSGGTHGARTALRSLAAYRSRAVGTTLKRLVNGSCGSPSLALSSYRDRLTAAKSSAASDEAGEGAAEHTASAHEKRALDDEPSQGAHTSFSSAASDARQQKEQASLVQHSVHDLDDVKAIVLKADGGQKRRRVTPAIERAFAVATAAGKGNALQNEKHTDSMCYSAVPAVKRDGFAVASATHTRDADLPLSPARASVANGGNVNAAVWIEAQMASGRAVPDFSDERPQRRGGIAVSGASRCHELRVSAGAEQCRVPLFVYGDDDVPAPLPSAASHVDDECLLDQNDDDPVRALANRGIGLLPSGNLQFIQP